MSIMTRIEKKLLQVRVPRREHARWVQAAAAEDMTLSEAVRHLMRLWAAARERGRSDHA
jgi:hypothetical protein